MKYLKDPNNIIAEFPKYLLTNEDPYTAIAYLIRDILNELSIKIKSNNSAIVVGLIQDTFDTLNPYINNIFSSFDLDYNTSGFTIVFAADWYSLIEKINYIEKTVSVKYKE